MEISDPAELGTLSLADMKVMPVVTLNLVHQHAYIKTSTEYFKHSFYVGLLNKKMKNGIKTAEF